jgi:hypothetical protein
MQSLTGLGTSQLAVCRKFPSLVSELHGEAVRLVWKPLGYVGPANSCPFRPGFRLGKACGIAEFWTHASVSPIIVGAACSGGFAGKRGNGFAVARS